MRRASLAGVAAIMLFTVNAQPAHGATLMPPSTQGCTDLFNPGENSGDAPLRKTIKAFSVVDGTATVTFTLTSSRSDDELDLVTRVRDCAFIDADGNRVLDDDERAYSFDLHLEAGTFVNDAEYTVSFPATEDGTICDRAAVSADASGGFTDKSVGPDGSDASCTDSGPPPIIPEAPLTVLLPLTAFAVLGTAAVALRRRHTTLPA